MSEDHNLLIDHMHTGDLNPDSCYRTLERMIIAPWNCATQIPPFQYPQLESNDKQCKIISNCINCRFSTISFSPDIISLHLAVSTLSNHHLSQPLLREYTIFINVFPLWTVYFKCISLLPVKRTFTFLMLYSKSNLVMIHKLLKK